MKFDKMCDVLLEGNKQSKQTKLIVGNDDPVFTPEDILRDPTDPSKGTKLYLASKEEKAKGLEPGDPASVRRQLRRVNWIARKMIKKFRGKEVSIDKLTKAISQNLEDYQVNVLGWGKPDKANTGYETRVIGNLLLPPTRRVPQGKSVFMSPGMDPSATAEQGKDKVINPTSKTKAVKSKLGDFEPTVTEPELFSAEDLHRSFEQMVQHLDAFFDDDLGDIIKAHAERGSTVRDILKDPAIKDVYDAQSVREVIRGMIKSDVLSKEPLTGELKLNPAGTSVGSKVFAARGSESDSPAPVLDIDADIGDESSLTSSEIEDDDAAAFDTDVIPDVAPASYGEEEKEAEEGEELAHDDDDDESDWWD